MSRPVGKTQKHTDPDFASEAGAIAGHGKHIELSERDSLLVLELLENSHTPPERLVRAAKAGGKKRSK